MGGNNPKDGVRSPFLRVGCSALIFGAKKTTIKLIPAKKPALITLAFIFWDGGDGNESRFWYVWPYEKFFLI
jgi:hypothetical protein